MTTTAASEPATLLTITQVAAACGVTVRRAAYAMDADGIEPRQRAGIIRLYHPDQLPAIRDAIAHSGERRFSRV